MRKFDYNKPLSIRQAGMRSWWAAENGADRLRLGHIPMDPQRQRGRFLEMLERAGRFYAV